MGPSSTGPQSSDVPEGNRSAMGTSLQEVGEGRPLVDPVDPWFLGQFEALLHQRRELSLPWPQRLPIALDVAKARKVETCNLSPHGLAQSAKNPAA